MILNDQVNFVGVFSIKAFNADGTVDEYTEKNLIMDEARRNMAQLVGGVTSTGDTRGMHINQFVLGTKGHNGTDILNYIKVGDAGFTSARTSLFSEATTGAKNYRIGFDVTGLNIVSYLTISCGLIILFEQLRCKNRLNISNPIRTYKGAKCLKFVLIL